MKKTFSCGHLGKGQFCHRCKVEGSAAAALVLEKQSEKDLTKQSKKEKVEKLNSIGVNLKNFPPQVVSKVSDIVDKLGAGTPYTVFKGKRLIQREMISIPIGYAYRMICREEPSKKVVPVEVMSHETYNTRVRVAMNGLM